MPLLDRYRIVDSNGLTLVNWVARAPIQGQPFAQKVERAWTVDLNDPDVLTFGTIYEAFQFVQTHFHPSQVDLLGLGIAPMRKDVERDPCISTRLH